VSVKMLVIDVLIPHDPDIIWFTESIAAIEGVDGATVHVLEIDEKTRTVEITIEGPDLVFITIKNVIEEHGGSIHSVDMVSAGKRLIESQVTDYEEE